MAWLLSSKLPITRKCSNTIIVWWWWTNKTMAAPNWWDPQGPTWTLWGWEVMEAQWVPLEVQQEWAVPQPALKETQVRKISISHSKLGTIIVDKVFYQKWKNVTSYIKCDGMQSLGNWIHFACKVSAPKHDHKACDLCDFLYFDYAFVISILQCGKMVIT